MGGFDTDRLDAVSKELGEAALDPTRWPALMDEICRAVSTTGAALLQSDIRTPDIPMTTSATEFIQYYFDNNLHVSDVRAVRGVPLLMAGAPVIRDQDLFSSERDMLRDPLYACAERYGFRWWAAIGFQAGSALWGLSLQRTLREGPFEESEILALTKLSQRLTETATLSKAVGRLVISGMTNALDLVQQPSIALDRLGFVIGTNALATEIFDDELRIRNRCLFVRDKQAKSALERFIDQLRTTPDTAALPASPIVVRRETKRPVVIRILPIDGAARSPFLGARALLVFSVPDQKRGLEPSMLTQAFGLTAAEARLATLVATGIPLDRAAEGLGIARETARKQLKAAFTKTGTHRQGELVALLSQM